MARALRVPAKNVRVGDLILTCYHWRTWKPVTKVVHRRPVCERDPCVMIDTTQCRVHFYPDEGVAWKPGVKAAPPRAGRGGRT